MARRPVVSAVCLRPACGADDEGRPPLHGVRLDHVVALHEAAVRGLETDETPVAGLPVTAVGLGADPSGALVAEIGEGFFRFTSPAAAVEAERRFASTEAGLGPDQIPPIDTVGFGALPVAPDPGARNVALPATAWTVGAKKILHRLVDFSELVGELKNGSTTYTAVYVQNLAATQGTLYRAASSFGQTTLTNTVSRPGFSVSPKPRPTEPPRAPPAPAPSCTPTPARRLSPTLPCQTTTASSSSSRARVSGTLSCAPATRSVGR